MHTILHVLWSERHKQQQQQKIELYFRMHRVKAGRLIETFCFVPGQSIVETLK